MSTLPNGTSSATKPLQLSIPLPHAPDTRIHIHLTNRSHSILLFLTTSSPEPSSLAPLGSFVYAMPNRSSPSNPLSTPLYTSPSSLDFTTRLARLLARKMDKPVYVGNSVTFASAGLGGTVEEEVEGFREVVRVVTRLLEGKGGRREEEEEEEDGSGE